MKALLLILTVLSITGCASTDYKEYVQAQAEANRLATDTAKPLVRLTAQPGQAITGLASLEVYAPTQAPVIQQARANEWAGVLGQGLSIAGTVLGIKVAGDAAIGLSDSVGKYSTAGYASIQAPQANISTINTTTTSNTNTLTATDSGNTTTHMIADSYNPVTTTTDTLTNVLPEAVSQ